MEVARKIVQQEKLPIRENTPIYDALLFRVRQALKQAAYKSRLQIAYISLVAFAVFLNIVQAYASNKETLPIAASAYENVIPLK